MSSLQHKLNNYEVTPPPAAWDHIAAALDENTADTPAYTARLYNMEVAPPAWVWDTISASLDTEDEKVVPLHKRRVGFYRYAIAAAVIILAGFGITRWIAGNNQQGSKDVAKLVPAQNPGVTEKNNPPARIQTTTGAKNTEAAIPAEKEPAMLAELEQPAKNHSRRINANGISAAIYSNQESMNDVYNNPIYAYEDHVPDMADRYIMLMTPEGKFIRMSKKWGNLICCVSGEEQDADCKDQLKKWQEKIAASPLAPSPGNFMDILSLVSSLEDNPGL